MGTDGDGEFDSPRAGRAFDALVTGARAAVVLRVTLARIRAEHEPSEHDPTACATCGSSGEYPVDWPCATRQLADEAIARVPA